MLILLFTSCRMLDEKITLLYLRDKYKAKTAVDYLSLKDWL